MEQSFHSIFFMENRIHIYCSGVMKDNIPQSHWDYLSSNGFASNNRVTSVGFCKDISSGELYVVFPKGLIVDSQSATIQKKSLSANHDIIRLVKLFKKIIRNTNFSVEYIKYNGYKKRLQTQTDPLLDSLEGMMALRKDFLNNGLYYRNHTKTKKNQNTLKINWQKTLSKSSPSLSEDGDVFYPETYHFRKTKDLSNLLYQAQVCCLHDIFSILGETQHLRALPPVPMTFMKLQNSYDYLSRLIRRKTFDDRGRQIFNLVTAYVNQVSVSEPASIRSQDLFASTPSFELIWEYILREVFGDPGQSRQLPTGNWVNYPKLETIPGITPEIDLFRTTPIAELLIDAKDYRLYNGNTPVRAGSSSDHYKQIIYRILIESRQSSNLFNILMFPDKVENNLFFIRGCHYWSEISNSLIFELGVDYNKVLSHFLSEKIIDVKKEFDALIVELNTVCTHVAKS